MTSSPGVAHYTQHTLPHISCKYYILDIGKYNEYYASFAVCGQRQMKIENSIISCSFNKNMCAKYLYIHFFAYRLNILNHNIIVIQYNLVI